MVRKMYLEERESKAGKVIEAITELCVVAVIGLFLVQYLLSPVKTESRSMEPTVVPSSVVYIDKICYAMSDISRYDVVAFKRKGETDSDPLIRRVVGLPGERIQIRRGVIYINGIPIDSSRYFSEITSDGIAGEELKLLENEYFVLGDTPANSEDSRSSTIGVVSGTQILGKAWLASKNGMQFYLIH